MFLLLCLCYALRLVFSLNVAIADSSKHFTGFINTILQSTGNLLDDVSPPVVFSANTLASVIISTSFQACAQREEFCDPVDARKNWQSIDVLLVSSLDGWGEYISYLQENILNGSPKDYSVSDLMKFNRKSVRFLIAVLNPKVVIYHCGEPYNYMQYFDELDGSFDDWEWDKGSNQQYTFSILNDFIDPLQSSSVTDRWSRRTVVVNSTFLFIHAHGESVYLPTTKTFLQRTAETSVVKDIRNQDYLEKLEFVFGFRERNVNRYVKPGAGLTVARRPTYRYIIGVSRLYSTYLPLFSTAFSEISTESNPYSPVELLIMSVTNKPSPSFKKNVAVPAMAYLYSHCVPYRETFYVQLSNTLERVKIGLSDNVEPKIKALGVCGGHNSIVGRVDVNGNMIFIHHEPNNTRDGVDTLDYMTVAKNMYSEYWFVMAFESFSYRGYVTEKLLLPLLAGSMPIYNGGALNRQGHMSFMMNADGSLPNDLPISWSLREDVLFRLFAGDDIDKSFNKVSSGKLPFIYCSIFNRREDDGAKYVYDHKRYSGSAEDIRQMDECIQSVIALLNMSFVGCNNNEVCKSEVLKSLQVGVNKLFVLPAVMSIDRLFPTLLWCYLFSWHPDSKDACTYSGYEYRRSDSPTAIPYEVKRTYDMYQNYRNNWLNLFSVIMKNGDIEYQM